MYQHHRDEKWRRNPRSILKDQQTLGREYSKAEKALKPRKKVRFNKEIQVVTLNQMDAKGNPSETPAESGGRIFEVQFAPGPSSAPSQNIFHLGRTQSRKGTKLSSIFSRDSIFQV